MSLPERDKYGYSKVELTSKLAMMFGGRVAEELIFGAENVTTGAGNDIQQATGMARRMVTEWGFSENLGPLRYSANEEEVFLGHSVTQQKNMSDQTADLIDSEVRSLIEDAEATARQVLEERKKDLELLAQALLEYENLSGGDIDALLRGEDIIRPTESDTPTDEGRRASVPTSGKKKRGRKSRMGWNLNLSLAPDEPLVFLYPTSCEHYRPLALITSWAFLRDDLQPSGFARRVGAKLAIDEAVRPNLWLAGV